MTCPECESATRVTKTTVSATATTRALTCVACGIRFESTETITHRYRSTQVAISGHIPPPVITGNHPSPVIASGGVGGGLSSDLNSVLIPVSSVPSQQSGSDPKAITRSDQAREPAYSDSFNCFWAAYPRKTAKGAAWKAWPKAAVHLPTILAALTWQRNSDEWQRDGGVYIPHPATWLNARRWEDEPTAIGPALPEKARISRMATSEWLGKKESFGG